MYIEAIDARSRRHGKGDNLLQERIEVAALLVWCEADFLIGNETEGMKKKSCEEV